MDYNLTINNSSGKDLKLTDVDAGEVEGKITLIDNEGTGRNKLVSDSIYPQRQSNLC